MEMSHDSDIDPLIITVTSRPPRRQSPNGKGGSYCTNIRFVDCGLKGSSRIDTARRHGRVNSKQLLREKLIFMDTSWLTPSLASQAFGTFLAKQSQKEFRNAAAAK
jgi:hypothetical protein